MVAQSLSWKILCRSKKWTTLKCENCWFFFWHRILLLVLQLDLNQETPKQLNWLKLLETSELQVFCLEQSACDLICVISVISFIIYSLHCVLFWSYTYIKKFITADNKILFFNIIIILFVLCSTFWEIRCGGLKIG